MSRTDFIEPPVAVITGATGGLGKLAALSLAKQGVRLALTARSRSRAEETRSWIADQVSGTQTTFFYGDLSLMSEVKRVGEEIAQSFGSIDILINNAGLHAFEPRVTSEGLPEMVAVNYLAPWLLTHTLLETLSRSERVARIVNVASEASRNHGTLRLPEALTDTASFTARGSSAVYGITKLLNIMFTAELARRLDERKVIANALNPGFNVTGLGRELRFAAPLERLLKLLRIGNPARGADIIVRLATASAFGKESGEYFDVGSGRKLEPVRPGGDPKMQRRLWNETEQLLKRGGWLL